MAETLDDLVSAIQYAVIEAMQVAEDHHINLVSRFFEEDKDSGQVRAITQEIWVPDMRPDAKDGMYVRIDVPIMSLASLGSMKIKELTVEFDARLSSLDTEVDDKEDRSPPKTRQVKAVPFRLGSRLGKRRRLAFDFKKGSDVQEGDSTKAHISITFQGTEPPEGVVRLNDRVLKTIP